MRVALLTSTASRHAYIAHRLAAEMDLCLVVREEKGLDTFYEGRPDAGKIADHFSRLQKTEEQFFGTYRWQDLPCDMSTVARGSLSLVAPAAALREAAPDAVVVFGPGIIKDPLLEALPSGRTINLHQGLSPYYRGSGTNFWPFYEERFDAMGVTLHYIDRGIDTGGIIAHGRPEIQVDDTLHTLGCKTVEVSATLVLRVLRALDSGVLLPGIDQWESGRLYQRKDMSGEVVDRVRELERTGALARFLENREAGRTAPLRLVTLD